MVDHLVAERARAMDEPRIVARGVTRTFPNGEGVAGLDLDVAAGEVHAIVGLNGAGKTTLMRLLLGMLSPHAGAVLVSGHDPRRAGPDVWERVGYLVDQPLAYPELDARTNLIAVATLHGVPRDQRAEMVDAAIVELDLGRYASVRSGSLSTGNRQRVGLAGALQHDVDVIVLDEPTNALDPAGVILLREALLRRAAGGTAILVSSHHLDEVARVADRITVINHGRAIGSIDPHGLDIERRFFELVHADDEALLS